MNHTEQTKKTLSNSITDLSNRFHNKTAIIDHNTSLTYTEFDQYTNQIANGIIKEGIEPESRIAFLGKDSSINYQVLFGCAKAKTVLVPINWRLSAQEVLTIVNDAEAKILFVDQAFSLTISQIEKELSSVVKIIVYNQTDSAWTNFDQWKSLQENTFTPEFSYQSTDIVLQMYTSGTTGKPKGVQLSNNSFFKLLDTMKLEYNDTWMDINNTDAVLHAVPFFHIGGLWWGVQSIIAGSTMVIQETFIAWQALEYIETVSYTHLTLPTICSV